MVGLPAAGSKRQLGLRTRAHIAVEKNGYSNLDVKRIWIGTKATSRGVEIAESPVNPAGGRVGSGIF